MLGSVTAAAAAATAAEVVRVGRLDDGGRAVVGNVGENVERSIGQRRRRQAARKTRAQRRRRGEARLAAATVDCVLQRRQDGGARVGEGEARVKDGPVGAERCGSAS